MSDVIIQTVSGVGVKGDPGTSNTKRNYVPVAAFAMDIAKDINTKSLTENATFTFTGTPTTGQRTSLKITTDATDRIVTLPSFWCRNRQVAITEVICYKNSIYLFEFEYTGTQWESDSYPLARHDYDNGSLSIGYEIGLNLNGTASVFIGDFIGVGRRQGVPFGPQMSLITDSVMIGVGACECVTGGNGIVAIGRLALGRSEAGSANTAIGDTALSKTATGEQNTAIGYESGTGNVTGDWNVFLGAWSGGVTNDKGDFNICVGGYAGDGRLGNHNIFVGFTSGPGLANGSTSCDFNIAVGFESGNSITTGDHNIFMGHQSGIGVTSGSQNLFLGKRSGADGQKADAVGSIGLGPNTQTTADYQMVLGHTDITETLIRGTVTRLIGTEVRAGGTVFAPAYQANAIYFSPDYIALAGYISGYGEAVLRTRVSNSTAGVGAPRQLYTYESRSLYTNVGATARVHLLLDNAYAGLGIEYEFVCLDADGIRIKCGIYDTIRDLATVSAAGGYIQSSVVGSTLKLKAVTADLWLVVSKTGTWTIDS